MGNSSWGDKKVKEVWACAMRAAADELSLQALELRLAAGDG